MPEATSLDELEQAIEAIGHDRFLFGSDYPMRSSGRYLDELRRRLDLDPKTLERILSHDPLGAVEGRR